jgi:hypothetical protein
VLTPPTFAQHLVERIPRAELTILEQAGHAPMWDAPAEFGRVVEQFLGGRSRPSERGSAGARKPAMPRLLPARQATQVA